MCVLFALWCLFIRARIKATVARHLHIVQLLRSAGANAVRNGRLPWQRRPICRPPMRKAKVGAPPPAGGAVKRALGKTSRDGPAARWPGRDEEARERWAEEEEEEEEEERASGLRTEGGNRRGRGQL